MAIEIRHHEPGKDLGDFVRVPHRVFAGDPNWVAPLDMLIREQLTPKTNPFFEHADVTLMTAWRDGELVGRASAQVDREHLKKHDDATGFFGFFDTIDDRAVAERLLDEAAAFLKKRGMRRMRGPASLSVNEEFGLLVEGFDYPPMLMMNHAMPYQGGLVEACGLQKVKDLYAFRYVVEPLPPRAKKAWDAVQAMPEVKIRSMSKKRLDEELRLVLAIQDDAWRENWGHVSLTPGEVKQAAEGLKLVISEELALMVEIDGHPAAMCIAIPNLNEAIRDLGGRLLPLGWAKLLWRLKVRGLTTARLFLFGIRPEYRKQRRYAPLSLAMIAEVAMRGTRIGYRSAELSWTLEDNTPINLPIKAMKGKLYKRYRVYEKPLVDDGG